LSSTRIIAEGMIVDPGALYEINLLVQSSIREYLHSFGHCRTNA